MPSSEKTIDLQVNYEAMSERHFQKSKMLNWGRERGTLFDKY
jgi:hypothetical protein